MDTSVRDRAVLKVLQEAKEPIGPSEIARRINQPWCVDDTGNPLSSRITPILRRIGAVRHAAGRWSEL